MPIQTNLTFLFNSNVFVKIINKFLILNTNHYDFLFLDDFNFSTIGDSLFYCGIWGLAFGYKHLLFLMVFSELMLLGLSINFIIDSIINSNFNGYIYAFLILNLAAAESAIGLGLLVVIFSVKKNTSFKVLSLLK